jgi:hypothetical protein
MVCRNKGALFAVYLSSRCTFRSVCNDEHKLRAKRMVHLCAFPDLTSRMGWIGPPFIFPPFTNTHTRTHHRSGTRFYLQQIINPRANRGCHTAAQAADDPGAEGRRPPPTPAIPNIVLEPCNGARPRTQSKDGLPHLHARSGGAIEELWLAASYIYRPQYVASHFVQGGFSHCQTDVHGAGINTLPYCDQNMPVAPTETRAQGEHEITQVT